MKKILSTIILFSLVQGCSSTKESLNVSEPFSVEGKQVTVYTTADSTNLRLTLSDKLTFQKGVQPLETEICVFVNPNKIY